MLTKSQNNMFYLACTRFNNKTYEENRKFRTTHNEITIYGSTLQIRNTYPTGALIFIIEMNNDTNKIEGIGLVKNLLVNKRHCIHENNEYNRYIYKGKYWLSRETIKTLDPEIIEILDTILFTGKSHLKCRIGITIITERLFVHWNYNLSPLKNKIKTVFLQYFKHNITDLDEDDNKNNCSDTDTIYIEIVPKKKQRKENRNKSIEI